MLSCDTSMLCFILCVFISALSVLTPFIRYHFIYIFFHMLEPPLYLFVVIIIAWVHAKSQAWVHVQNIRKTWVHVYA